jgi:ATP-dependent Clp protease protease subunit
MTKMDTFAGGLTDDEPYIWVTEFDDETLSRFYKKFLELESAPLVPIIPVLISSYGGDVAILMAMRDLIKSSTKPVATVALGKAMSSGACLLAAGTKGFRFASKDTTIMIHEVSGGVMGKVTDVNEQAAMMHDLNKKLLANLAKDSGRSSKEIDKKLKSKKNADWALSSMEAKEWGIIDHIAIPRMMISSPGVALMKNETYEEAVLKTQKTKVVSTQKKNKK